MTDELILEKAIEKAEKGGWVHCPLVTFMEDGTHWKFNGVDAYRSFVFTLEFAEAFWKDEDEELWEEIKQAYKKTGREPTVEHQWHFHLEMMVVEEDPLQYLKEFL